MVFPVSDPSSDDLVAPKTYHLSVDPHGQDKALGIGYLGLTVGFVYHWSSQAGVRLYRLLGSGHHVQLLRSYEL